MAKPNEKTPVQDTSRWGDDWVTKLVADSTATPNAVALTGFIGRAPDRNSVRVFLHADLQSWVDIPANAILHREAIPKTVSPLGGSYLWVERTAWPNCKMGQAEQQQPQQAQPQQPQQPQPPQPPQPK
jgi:hypothetical protein